MSFGWAIRAVAVAALVEFGLLRVVLRLGPVLPWTPAAKALFDGVVLAGTAALNAAAILGAIAVALWVFKEADFGPRRWAVALTGTSLVVGSFIPLAELAGAWAAGLALVALLGGFEARSRVALLPATAYGAVAVYWIIGAETGTGLWVGLAEAAAVGLGFWFFFRNLPLRSLRRLAGGLLAGLALTATLYLAGWLVKAVGIWTVGISFFLPAPFYGLALAGLLWQLLADRQDVRGVGLLLLVLGGLRVDVSYFALLSLTGLLGWQYPGPRFRPPGGPALQTGAGAASVVRSSPTGRALRGRI